MYSPGALNVAVAVALPPAVRSIDGLGLSNLTAPGPRNMLQAIVSGALMPRAPRPRPPRPTSGPAGSAGGGGSTLIVGPRSVAHVVSAKGLASAVLYCAAIAAGGPVNVRPACSNFNTGGVFPDAASLNGSTTHSGRVCKVMMLVCWLATIVQVSFLFPKSFGTVIVNTPHWWPV